MTARVVLTVAALTLREAARRRVAWALLVMTVLLLGLSAWGFSRIGAEFTGLTTGEAKLTASAILNLVLFGISLIAVLGTAFLAGPTLAGEVESGIVLSMLARPVHRSAVLVGKWLGLVAFGAGFITVAVVAQLIIVWLTTGYWPPDPLLGILLLSAQTAVLLTLGLLLSTAISPMASGMVAVGLFGATWIAGVVGGVGDAIGNEGMGQAGSVSRMLLPTDGLWRGAMYAFQDRTVFARFGEQMGGTPFISPGALTLGYQVWVLVWVGVVLGLAALAFRRRDL